MSGESLDGIDHEENCAACGVNPRKEGGRHCESCHDELMTDGGQSAGESGQKGSGIPEGTPHESPKNNRGHITMAHRHLMNLTPEGLSEKDWSRLVIAYELVRSVKEENGDSPALMEGWDNRGPRRFRCNGCGSVFLTRNELADADDLILVESPNTCPFCVHGEEIEVVDGWYVQTDTHQTEEESTHE